MNAPTLTAPRNPLDEVRRVLAPTTLDDALDALAQDGATVVLAGGTDLMPQSRAGRGRAATTLLNVRRIAALDGIRVDGDHLVLGALTAVSALLTDPLVRAHAPLLATAADHFASDQIRNAATIGGNLCNASPAGDLLTPLLALDAEVELASRGDDGGVARRWLALGAFFVGPGRTAREGRELLTAVRLPCASPQQVTRFYKSGTRPALDISAVAIAFVARRDARGVLRDVRLALGAVAPTPLRARHAEALLEGNPLGQPLTAQTALCASEEVAPIDDVRASAWYRKELVRNMTQRVLDDVAEH